MTDLTGDRLEASSWVDVLRRANAALEACWKFSTEVACCSDDWFLDRRTVSLLCCSELWYCTFGLRSRRLIPRLAAARSSSSACWFMKNASWIIASGVGIFLCFRFTTPSESFTSRVLCQWWSCVDVWLVVESTLSLRGRCLPDRERPVNYTVIV